MCVQHAGCLKTDNAEDAGVFALQITARFIVKNDLEDDTFLIYFKIMTNLHSCNIKEDFI